MIQNRRSKHNVGKNGRVIVMGQGFYVFTAGRERMSDTGGSFHRFARNKIRICSIEKMHR